MQLDIELWKNPKGISADEHSAFETVLGLFTTADSIAANNVVMGFYQHVTSPEISMYLLRKAFEEAIHTHAYQYIVESLGMNEAKIFNMYREVYSIFNKEEFILGFNEEYGS